MPAAPPLAALVLLVAALPARADLAQAFAAHPEGGALRALWSEARALEADDELDASLARFEQLARALPDEPEPRWRLARLEWRRGERIPPEQKEARLARFRAAEQHARDGLALDPRCAECLFWQAAALGRVTTNEGVLQSARLVPVIADLLARAIALEPTHSDGPDDTTLGNLYHYSAAFYRLVPEWIWLSWVLGVRGDRERSVELSRRAVAISPRRLDYQVELGAGLLCLGTARRRDDFLREGAAVLRHSESLPAFAEARLDRSYARALLARPERACAWARDGWIDLDERDVAASRR